MARALQEVRLKRRLAMAMLGLAVLMWLVAIPSRSTRPPLLPGFVNAVGVPFACLFLVGQVLYWRHFRLQLGFWWVGIAGAWMWALSMVGAMPRWGSWAAVFFAGSLANAVVIAVKALHDRRPGEPLLS